MSGRRDEWIEEGVRNEIGVEQRQVGWVRGKVEFEK
jgi:hypothetical protein